MSSRTSLTSKKRSYSPRIRYPWSLSRERPWTHASTHGHLLPAISANRKWDKLHAGYFNSYALWGYLTTPFLYTYPGFETQEIEPWYEDGERWRVLQVTFPDGYAAHT